METLPETYGTQLRPQFIAGKPSNLQFTTNYLTFYPPANLNNSLFSVWSQISSLAPASNPETGATITNLTPVQHLDEAWPEEVSECAAVTAALTSDPCPLSLDLIGCVPQA